MAKIFVNLLSYTGLKGGMERYTRELYRALGAMDTGHEWGGYASLECMKLDRSWFPGEIIPSGISGENRIQWAFGELERVGRAARKHGAELVHSPATLGPRKTSMPAVYTMHDMLYFSLPDLMEVKAYNKPVQWMEKLAARNAARIVTDSAVSKAEIVKFLGFPEDSIDVIHLGATPPTTPASSDTQREPDLFLATGQRLKHKNFDRLIEAVGLIEPQRRPRLVITGSFKEDPLIDVVERHALGDWVELRAWIPQEELEWLWHHATALVVPGLHDGYSLPTVEAMHAGLPVLASNAAVFREVAGDAAHYFDPHSPEAIAAALTRAMDEPEMLQELAARGLTRSALFTWERTARETLAVFNKVLAPSQS